MAINQNWVELLRKKKFPGRSTILRFFHFGPFITFALIFSISIITYYYAFVRKWPLLQPLPARIPHYLRSAFFSYATLERVIPLNALNCAAYCLCVGLLLWHYIIAIVKGPGYAEAGWVPKNLPQPDQHLQFCSQCFAFKPPRAHHCKSCNRCVYKMDHHCPWINNCVGHHNHKSFILFLVYTIISCTYSTFLLIPCVLDIIYPIWRRPRFGIRHSEATPLIVITFAALMAFALVIALGMLLWGQLEGVNENATFIEAWIISKAERRAKVEDLDPFIYPYDLGCWRNWKTVFGDRVISWGLVWPFCQKPASLSSSFIGDGVNYRVLSECDQYSLTREQLQQKKNKKKLKKQQRVLIRDTFSPTQGVWGKCPPVLLYNMCLGGNKLTHTISYSSIIGAFADGVTLHEDLMIVNAGDVVEVTRVNKHWLYGHKLTDEEVEALKNEHNNNNNNNNDDDDEDVEDDDEIEPGLVKEKKDAKDGSESRKRKANSNETEGEKGLICKEYHERGWFPRVCVQAKGTKQQ